MNKVALIVGINKYKNYPDARLKGCVNDLKNHNKFLVNQLGFNEGNIVSLSDDSATKSNIIKTLDEFISSANKGVINYIYFSISCHGTQFPNNDSYEEADSLDEAYCPYDISGSKSSFILDNELYDRFKAMNKECVVEVFADSCHSGDSVRAAFLNGKYRKDRYFELPEMRELRESEEGSKFLFWGNNKKNSKEQKPALENIILWAGCKSDQTSADASINGSFNGAFTYYLFDNYKKSIKRSDLIKDTQYDVRREGFSQEPQLECKDIFKEKTIGEI